MEISKWLLVVLFVAETAFGCFSQQKMGTLVLIDQSDSSSVMAKSYLLPYLDHFGIAYEIADIHTKKLSRSAGDYALMIIGHDMKHPEVASKLVRKLQSKGAGLVSFDPDWPFNNLDKPSTTNNAKSIFFNTGHYITALHEKTDTIKCSIGLPIRNVSTGTMIPIVFADGRPLILVSATGDRRSVSFTSMDWMKTAYIGPMMGLDDCLWRSMVWAARKPFVMRGLPPLVTMRVDDVAGRGEIMQQSPLYWVKTANKYGFKPWLGLFIYNLSPVAVQELRGYLLNNQATASPHAFGRPNRDQRSNEASDSDAGRSFVQTNSRFYYNPECLPLRVNSYDEFIYFNHHTGMPWSDAEALHGLEAVDEWYAKNQPLPMSKYFLAHWYEMGSNIISHVSKKWGMEYIGMNKAINTPYIDSIPWLKGAPFRLYEKQGKTTNASKAVYYADFVDVNGNKFFNSLTEIRDDYGYEWAPDNETEISAARGVRQLKRALSSMALASLFTHETDYIFKIKPENWEEQFKLISKGISDFNPMMITIDEALKILRAHKTSHLSESDFSKGNGRIDISLEGDTDIRSYVYLFTGGNGSINQKLVEIPEFKRSIKFTLQTKSDNPTPGSK